MDIDWIIEQLKFVENTTDTRSKYILQKVIKHIIENKENIQQPHISHDTDDILSRAFNFKMEYT